MQKILNQTVWTVENPAGPQILLCDIKIKILPANV